MTSRPVLITGNCAPNSAGLVSLSSHGGQPERLTIACCENEVDSVASSTQSVMSQWKMATCNDRVHHLRQFVSLLSKFSCELASLVSREDGANEEESVAKVSKSIEAVEWAVSMTLTESNVVNSPWGEEYAHELRQPVGTVATMSERCSSSKNNLFFVCQFIICA